MLRIGPVQLASRVLLAPVAGHCDVAFRLTARACGGVGLAFTDLLCPHGVLKQNRQTRWLMASNERDRPLGMQLYGQHAPLMAEAARWAADEGATTVDINMGCPVDKVTKTFAGSMMLCTPGHTVSVAEALVKAVGDRVPVTAKMRLGYHAGERTAPSLARALVNAGVSCITIHGRTAAQRFKGQVDHEGIAAVVSAVHEAGARRVPCIGNGDIRTPFDARRMMDLTDCDGVMIARAALGAPWIFRDTDHYLSHGVLPEPLTLRQRVECMRMHFRELLALRELGYALNRMRQKISGYGKHFGPCKSLRIAVQTVATAEQFEAALDRYVEDAGESADRVPVTWEDRDAIFHDGEEEAGQAGATFATAETGP